MKLTLVGSPCRNGNCPAVYKTERDTLVVQGWMVVDLDALRTLGLPDGETAVEIPREVLLAAALEIRS